MKKLITIILMLLAINVSAQQFLLCGTDKTDPLGSKGNSDVIMILTVSKTVFKLTSIMRDTYVNIPGHGWDKINAAFEIGGRDLLSETINRNFGTDIRNSLALDFEDAIAIVDCLNGIDIVVKPEVFPYMDNYIKQQALLTGTKPKYMSKSGAQHLNGNQTLAYIRVRDGKLDDYKRIQRQNDVIQVILEKAFAAKKNNIDCLISLWWNFDKNIQNDKAFGIFTAMMKRGKQHAYNKFPGALGIKQRINNKEVIKITDFKVASAKLKSLIK